MAIENKKQYKDNVKILGMIVDIMNRFPDYPFNQILCNLNLVPIPTDMAYSEELRVYLKEFYYEDPADTLARIQIMYEKLTNADKRETP